MTGNFVGETSWKSLSERSSSGTHRRILETQAERSKVPEAGSYPSTNIVSGDCLSSFATVPSVIRIHFFVPVRKILYIGCAICRDTHELNGNTLL